MNQLSRMLQDLQKVKTAEVKAEKISDNEFKIEIMAENYTPADEEEEIVCAPSAKVILSLLYHPRDGTRRESSCQTLIKAFLFAVTKQDKLPSKVLFYNSGAYLTCEDSDSLEDLKTLEAEGVEIYTCGTCLNFYDITDKLAVGSITNMYDIVEMMEKAGKVIKP